MASLGIDYGTGSWKFALIEGPRVLALKWFPDPAELYPMLEETTRTYPHLPIVLPSGFGIPLRRIQEVDDRDLFEMTLRRGDPSEKGLGQFLSRLRESDLRAVACLLHLQMARGESLETQDFLSVEVGEGFKAILVVRGGRVVDGLGGTAGHLGPRAPGALDGGRAGLYPFCKA